MAVRAVLGELVSGRELPDLQGKYREFIRDLAFLWSQALRSDVVVGLYQASSLGPGTGKIALRIREA